MQIIKANVGRIAERIVANELEARGIRVGDRAFIRRNGCTVGLDLVHLLDYISFNIRLFNGPKG